MEADRGTGLVPHPMYDEHHRYDGGDADKKIIWLEGDQYKLRRKPGIIHADKHIIDGEFETRRIKFEVECRRARGLHSYILSLHTKPIYGKTGKLIGEYVALPYSRSRRNEKPPSSVVFY
jgi:hypothetical protein